MAASEEYPNQSVAAGGSVSFNGHGYRGLLVYVANDSVNPAFVSATVRMGTVLATVINGYALPVANSLAFWFGNTGFPATPVYSPSALAAGAAAPFLPLGEVVTLSCTQAATFQFVAFRD